MFKKTTNEVDTKIAKTNLTNAKEVLNLTREVENQDLWKIYGRDSEAGKMLFKLFGKGHNAVKVDYPKPKTQKKPLPFEDTNKRPKVTPVSKTVIEYPTMANPLIRVPKIHAVDLIPKRKNEVEIRKEIDEFYSKPVIPANKGQNRKEMITELQAKFKKQRGALPKGAELPLVQAGDQDVLAEVNEAEIKQRALQKVPKKHLRFTYEKPKSDQENKKGITKQEGDEELEALYSEIEREIEERQNYLEEIMSLDEPKIKERVKKEIVERVAELQKIIGMMRREE